METLKQTLFNSYAIEFGCKKDIEVVPNPSTNTSHDDEQQRKPVTG